MKNYENPEIEVIELETEEVMVNDPWETSTLV